ncbi:MAG: Gfo/Idh/MocA family oxidoreductase [Puniceicoccales bacterium]|jgi:predicted dehydrogenase|nr:Gfo/Idh/MocA family oxidoreductase [Puniceicoccales bacterium]
MLNIGIIGLGSMGTTHLNAYAERKDVTVVAVADAKFASAGTQVGRAGNIPGQSGTIAIPATATRYVTTTALLADPAVEAVDICLPTLAHKDAALEAIRAGKHVLVEKPLARTVADAREIADAARASGVVLMPAHCMRFWPGWDWLKEAVTDGRFGAVQSAEFIRIGAKPPVPLYNDGAACGGAHLDLHIHDTDFVLHLFGMPDAVTSFGRVGESGAIEHTFTHYHYKGGALVTAEGAWTRDAEQRPFVMRYCVTFEQASVAFEFGTPPALTLYQAGKEPQAVALAPELGYEREIAEFVRCATSGVNSEIAPPDAGFHAIEIIEAELRSIESGTTQKLGANSAQ